LKSGAIPMLNAGGNKVIGKASQRKGKTERRVSKAVPRKQAGEEQGLEAEPKPDQLQHAEEQINEQISEQISTPVASMDVSPLGPSVTDIIPTVPAVSAEPVVVSIATIANAYGAYTGKSVELTWSFLEKLAAARSLDKAFEAQTEFAKHAFETFLAESRKIHELHSELARQRVVHLDVFVARMTRTAFAQRATRH
jgi:phasin family protein